MIKIDGRTYNVPITAVNRKAEFLYKYAERTEDGVLHSELIGVYYNFDVEARNVKKDKEYGELWKKLVSVPNEHKVTLWLDEGEYTQDAYFSGISDRLVTIKDGVTYSELKFKVVAIRPVGVMV